MPSAAGLWLVLKPAVTGAASDVYLGGVYIPLAQSALLRTSSVSDRFAALTEAASAASARGRVMIMGDFNARVAARSDIGDDHASSLLALDLPVVRACTDRSFGAHGRHLLQLCLSAGLVLGTGRLAGDAHAAISYPHAAGGSRPDHVLLDVGLLPEALQSKVDVSRRESDHFPLLTIIRRQPFARPSTVDTANGGRPLPMLSWASGCRKSYVERLEASSLNIQDCMQLAQSGALTESCQQLSAILVQSAASAGCRYKPAAAAAQPSRGPRRDHRPFFDRECKSLKRLYQRVRSSDPEMARVLRRKYAHVVRRKCRVYRQQQTHILLREIHRKPQDFWKKLNGRPEPLPQPLQRQGQWRQYVSDLCAPATAAVPQPVVAAPAAACQAAEPLNQPITSAEVESALPLLNNNRSGAGQGRAGLQSCCAMLIGRFRTRMAKLRSSMCSHVPLRPFSMLRFSVASFLMMSSRPL